MTSQLAMVTCKRVKLLDHGSQSVKLLLTYFSHFCSLFSPFLWAMDRYVFEFGMQWVEGMGSGKLRINTGLPLSALQNSEKKVNMNIRLISKVPLNMGAPSESRCCHKFERNLKHVNLHLQFSSQYFFAFVIFQLF